jgi:hypothetical protein
VREHRDLGAERGEHVDLSRRVVEVIIAADHMGHAHVHVIDDHAKIVGRRTVGARDNQIIQLSIFEGDIAVHEVMHHDLALERILEADDRLDAGTRVATIAPAAVVTRFFLARHLFAAQLLEFFLGAVAAIRLAGCEELLDHLAIARKARGLEERTLVGREPEPAHALENHPHRFVGGALAIGILDPQDEFAAMATGMEPGKERRAHAADMQHAGGAWGEAGNDRRGGRHRARMLAHLHPKFADRVAPP